MISVNAIAFLEHFHNFVNLFSFASVSVIIFYIFFIEKFDLFVFVHICFGLNFRFKEGANRLGRFMFLILSFLRLFQKIRRLALYHTAL